MDDSFQDCQDPELIQLQVKLTNYHSSFVFESRNLVGNTLSVVLSIRKEHFVPRYR